MNGCPTGIFINNCNNQLLGSLYICMCKQDVDYIRLYYIYIYIYYAYYCISYKHVGSSYYISDSRQKMAQENQKKILQDAYVQQHGWMILHLGITTPWKMGTSCWIVDILDILKHFCGLDVVVSGSPDKLVQGVEYMLSLLVCCSWLMTS